MSIGRQFHHETSIDNRGYKGGSPQYGQTVPLYKTYRDAPRVKLPEAPSTGISVEEAIRRRRSERRFTAQPIAPEQLAQLLLSAYGITHSEPGYDLRAAPSGGALYPIEVYVLIHNVESLTPGLYHFQVADHSLELVREGDLAKEAHRVSLNQDAVGASPITLVLTARFDRTTAKYADRGYRYVYMEAGLVGENIHLQAVSLGLGTVVVGAFNDDAANELLGIDGEHEATLLLMPVGYPRRS